MGGKKIDGDPAYPIYRIIVKWRGPKGKDDTSFYKMYREDPGKDAVLAWLKDEWWPQFCRHPRRASKRLSDPSFEIRGPYHETWCLEWFCHYTFDMGQTDEEALASFERYVRRHEHKQRPGYRGDDYICLMGAEDRWRWYGEPPVEAGNPPPCRCRHCQEQGVLRIGH